MVLNSQAVGLNLTTVDITFRGNKENVMVCPPSIPTTSLPQYIVFVGKSWLTKTAVWAPLSFYCLRKFIDYLKMKYRSSKLELHLSEWSVKPACLFWGWPKSFGIGAVDLLSWLSSNMLQRQLQLSNLTSTKTASFCHSQAEVVTFSVLQYYGNPYSDSPFC